MSKPILIRPADLVNPADAAAVVDLIDAYAADPMGGGVPLTAAVRARLAQAIHEAPGHLALLALDGSEAVGVALAFQGLSSFHARPLINVHDLAVRSEWRGRGVGRALLAAVEVEARRRGCCKLTLEVREDNGAAARLYRSAGFGPGSAAGEAVQFQFMEKRLIG